MSVLQTLSPIITISAVLVALFKDEFWSYIKRPKLNVLMKLKTPHCTKTKFLNNNIDAYYIRLLVQNTGMQVSKNTQVFAYELLKLGIENNESVNGFLPMNLTWSYIKKTELDVYPKMFRFCDLGYIIKNENNNNIEMILDTEITQHNIIESNNNYQLKIKVFSENTHPIDYTLKISINKWIEEESEMFKDGMHISILKN